MTPLVKVDVDVFNLNAFVFSLIQLAPRSSHHMLMYSTTYSFVDCITCAPNSLYLHLISYLMVRDVLVPWKVNLFLVVHIIFFCFINFVYFLLIVCVYFTRSLFASPLSNMPSIIDQHPSYAQISGQGMEA